MRQFPAALYLESRYSKLMHAFAPQSGCAVIVIAPVWNPNRGGIFVSYATSTVHPGDDVTREYVVNTLVTWNGELVGWK